MVRSRISDEIIILFVYSTNVIYCPPYNLGNLFCVINDIRSTSMINIYLNPTHVDETLCKTNYYRWFFIFWYVKKSLILKVH